jgi:hypothetical protein
VSSWGFPAAAGAPYRPTREAAQIMVRRASGSDHRAASSHREVEDDSIQSERVSWAAPAWVG